MDAQITTTFDRSDVYNQLIDQGFLHDEADEVARQFKHEMITVHIYKGTNSPHNVLGISFGKHTKQEPQ